MWIFSIFVCLHTGPLFLNVLGAVKCDNTSPGGTWKGKDWGKNSWMQVKGGMGKKEWEENVAEIAGRRPSKSLSADHIFVSSKIIFILFVTLVFYTKVHISYGGKFPCLLTLPDPALKAIWPSQYVSCSWYTCELRQGVGGSRLRWRPSI